jgi:hypothetical protein
MPADSEVDNSESVNRLNSDNALFTDLDPSSSFESTFRSFMQQQQQTNLLMLQLMQKLSIQPNVSVSDPTVLGLSSTVRGSSPTTAVSSDSVKPSYVPISELPKFSESISSEDSLQYLGIRHLDNLSDNDRIIVRTLKFLSFRSRFVKLTLTFPENIRLQNLYCCLIGPAQDRAVMEDVSTCDELLTILAGWYASATDPGALEDVLREKLERTVPFYKEALSDYILRFSQYFKYAREALSDFPLSESACCRLFLNSLRKRLKLFSSMISANAKKIQKLDDLFRLARDCENNVHVIEAAERAVMPDNRPERNQPQLPDSHQTNQIRNYGTREYHPNSRPVPFNNSNQNSRNSSVKRVSFSSVASSEQSPSYVEEVLVSPSSDAYAEDLPVPSSSIARCAFRTLLMFPQIALLWNHLLPIPTQKLSILVL